MRLLTITLAAAGLFVSSVSASAQDSGWSSDQKDEAAKETREDVKDSLDTIGSEEKTGMDPQTLPSPPVSVDEVRQQTGNLVDQGSNLLGSLR